MRRKTKQDERREMLKLMERRERKAPEHHSPEWLHRYWKQVSQ